MSEKTQVMAERQMPQSMSRNGGGGGTLYDVLELILDRGLVIDAYVRVSLVGIELLTIDVRVVVASVDTYLRFAEACNRLDIANSGKSETLPEMVGSMTESGARGKTQGAVGGITKSLTESFREGVRDRGKNDDQEQEQGQSKEETTTRPRSRSRQSQRES